VGLSGTSELVPFPSVLIKRWPTLLRFQLEIQGYVAAAGFEFALPILESVLAHRHDVLSAGHFNA
jgi:hypothetical protein